MIKIPDIITNRIRCTKCGDVLESKGVHDLVWCKCRSVAINGGQKYLKRLFTNKNDYEELSVVEKGHKPTIEEMERALGLDKCGAIYVNSGDDTEDMAQKGDVFADWYEEELRERYKRLNNPE